MTTLTLQDTLAQLEALGNERMRAQNKRNGAGDNQFGVRLGDIRQVAKKIKAGRELAMALWETGNIEARLLAILLLKPKDLTTADLERMVREVSFVQVADWFNAYIVSKHPDRESLREAWMNSDHPWAARAGWNLTSQHISASPEGIDLAALLDRIESEMPSAPAEVQWTMNFCLAGIGIHSAEQRERAISIGETLGIYRDYPVPKGCTSPFAPIWINEMVRRQG